MKKIKFSHLYNKLRGIDLSKPVKLIDLILIRGDSISKDFIEYDTEYWHDGIKKNYPLNLSVEHILLFFKDDKGLLFTTIRRKTDRKLEYYKSNLGKLFQLEIKKVEYTDSEKKFLKCVLTDENGKISI